MEDEGNALSQEVEGELVIVSKSDEQEVAQAPRGGRKGKKKQKWKPLDMTTVTSTPSSQTAQPSQSVPGQTSSGWGGAQGRPSHTSSRQSGSESYSQQAYGSSNQRYDQNPGYHERGSNEQLSRALISLLRHKKPYDIPISRGGYARVDAIVAHPRFQQFYTTENAIFKLVNADNKKRYEVSGSPGNDFQIRATQGHSFKLEAEESGLEPITRAKDYSTVVHGTYKNAWRFIKKEGLKKMNRAYIHFAIGLIGETHVTSGMRYSSEIVIELDLEKALAAGLKFFASKNGVVLTEGDENGIVSPKYFKTVKKYDNQTGKFQDINFVFEG